MTRTASFASRFAAPVQATASRGASSGAAAVARPVLDVGASVPPPKGTLAQIAADFMLPQHTSANRLPAPEVVHRAMAHDSAWKHVTGQARYVDDLPEPPGMVHVLVGSSPHAHARLLSVELDAVRAAPGVLCAFSAAEIPGRNDVSPSVGDDPLLAENEVHFLGQPVFAVAAATPAAAADALALAKVRYEPRKAVLSIEEALKQKSYVADPHAMRRGNAKQALDNAPQRLQGNLYIGGQDHFYLEGQVSLAVPGEDGEVTLYCSTQHPSEVQHLVAGVLGVADSAVTVEVRRMGGAFGGKESQASQWAALAALAARLTGRAAKMRLDRDSDMVMTGKRHDFLVRYDVGFDETGRVQGLFVELASRCGFSADLSVPVNDRAMFHVDNAYCLDHIEIVSYRCRTNTVSNTAFRGFGGPQGMMAIERVMDAIAQHLKVDPLTVRKRNFYGRGRTNITPYHMRVTDNVIPQIVRSLLASSNYARRRRAIRNFNRNNQWIHRGIALTPVKFGISFTMPHLNQAGALIHIYTDGSVHLNHGGTEMGQGLFIKVAQVTANALGVSVDQVRPIATNTAKVPNTSATAASSGADLNGMAACIAADTLRKRLERFALEHLDARADQLRFAGGRVRLDARREISFVDLVRGAYQARVPLSATGFYKTPKLHYDRQRSSGRPFYYFAYGAAVSEVALDLLTGECRVLRVDLQHDVGQSLNPAVDLGQIEGGFMQGLGWLTSEELYWNEQGALMTHAPSTYKIPACSDRPEVFQMHFWERGRNSEATIHRSKAVGEPPLMLAISVFSAIVDALSDVGQAGAQPILDAPATPERILMAAEALRSELHAA